MPDLLDQIAEKRRDLLDVVTEEKEQPFDPSEPPLIAPLPKKKPWVEGSIFQKGAFYGLGAIAWPWQRLEWTIATPLTAVVEARKKTMAERGIDKGFAVLTPRLIKSEEAQRESDEINATLAAVGRGWSTGMGTEPEGVKTFNDFFGSYYEALTGEEASGWYKAIAGSGTAFLITPYLFGKILKGIVGGAKATGIPARIAARRLPAWQQMKRLARLETGARITSAQDMGKSLGNREIRRLAKALSERTGRTISSNAVKLRLTQIIKGGITTQPELAAKANPVINEFVRMSKELKTLGILPEHTFLSRLPRKEATALMTKRAGLQTQLDKLGKVPHKEVLTKLVTNLKIKGKEKLTADLWNLANTVNRNETAYIDKLGTILGVKTSQPAKLMKMVESYAKASTKERGAIIDQLWKLGDEVMGQKISGLKSLMTKIQSMRKTFPGQAKITTNIQNQIKDIDRQILQSVHVGADILELEKGGLYISGGGEGYFPRMYLTKETTTKRIADFAKTKIRAPFAKKRKALPEDVRKALGQIKSPAYPVTKRMIQEGNAIETAKLFEFAAGNPNWVSTTWKPGFIKKPLPDTKAYGALRNKFVHPTIHKDVTAMFRIKSDFEALYDTTIGAWKLGKTIWSPALHFRNMFSNGILLDLSGMDHIQQVKYFGKALSHIKQNSVEYQTARKYFMRTTMVHGELLDDMLRGFKDVEGGEQGLRAFINGINKTISKVSAKPSQIYQGEEFIAKFIKYLEQIDKGKTPIQAIQEANKWLFDYTDLAEWEVRYARRIMPFYTFPRKAIPRILEAAVNRPLVLAKYPMLAKSMTQISLQNLDLTAKDYERIEDLLPEFMSKGSYILMPYRDGNGDLQFFDWTWNVPWGGLFEAEQRGLMKSAITNPLAQLVYDIMGNKSSWSGRKIFDDAIPLDKQTSAYRREQSYKKMLYVWQALAPSLAYKGIYWDKLYGAATGKKSRGKDMLLPQAVAHTIFGARTQALDETEARRWQLMRMKEGFDDLRGNMIKVLTERANEDITEKEFNRRWDIYVEQLQKFHSEASTEDENAPTIEELLDTIEELVENPEEEGEKND